MCAELDNNRRILGDIIYSKRKPFTETKIITEFKRKTGSKLVDARLGVQGYLKYLRGLGVLELHGIHYTVLPTEDWFM
jgi:hypothetical protein